MRTMANDLGGVRRELLQVLKTDGPCSAQELAECLGLTKQAVSQHLRKLVSEGWVERRRRSRPSGRAGRPVFEYRVSVAGDHLFPKQYDELLDEVLDVVSARFGVEALETVLTGITERRVQTLAPRFDGRSFHTRVAALDGIYRREDPPAFVETNCPYLGTAMKYPEVCRCTMRVMGRLLGRKVTREKSFQDGDGCCLFQVHPESEQTDRQTAVTNH